MGVFENVLISITRAIYYSYNRACIKSVVLLYWVWVGKCVCCTLNIEQSGDSGFERDNGFPFPIVFLPHTHKTNTIYLLRCESDTPLMHMHSIIVCLVGACLAIVKYKIVYTCQPTAYGAMVKGEIYSQRK